MNAKTPLTVHGAELLRTELHELKTVQRPAIIAAIAEARSHGDLSENAEYDAAKEAQGLLEMKISKLENIIANAEVIDPAKMSGSKVYFGATVEIVDCKTDEEKTYQIVNEYEANIELGKISNTSPIARGLIGKEEGDVVKVTTPGGIKEYEILKVVYK
jgi:transcription elongation factor GreA